jgi:hypothetical protein
LPLLFSRSSSPVALSPGGERERPTSRQLKSRDGRLLHWIALCRSFQLDLQPSHSSGSAWQPSHALCVRRQTGLAACNLLQRAVLAVDSSIRAFCGDYPADSAEEVYPYARHVPGGDIVSGGVGRPDSLIRCARSTRECIQSRYSYCTVDPLLPDRRRRYPLLSLCIGDTIPS